MFLMGIFWYHLYDMSNYKLCNLDTYNHNFGSSMEQAQNAPTPATIFTLFYNGKFVTTDLSVCLEGRLSKALGCDSGE